MIQEMNAGFMFFLLKEIENELFQLLFNLYFFMWKKNKKFMGFGKNLTQIVISC
jgi:hypothetical protein